MNAAVNDQQNLNPPSVGAHPPIILSTLSQRDDARQIIHPNVVDPVKKLVTTTPNFEKYTSTSTKPTTGKGGNNVTDLTPMGIPKPGRCSIL